MTDPNSISPVQLRREEEKEQRRQDIIDAAEKIIAQSSWGETNFGEIAKLTRLSRSLIYVYFPTRKALFDAICNRGAVVLQRVFAEAMAREERGLGQVEAIARAYYHFSREFPVYFALHSEELAQDGEEGESQAGYSHPALQLLGRALARGLADGSISPAIGDLKLSTITLWTFTHGLLLIAVRKAKLLEQIDTSVPAVVEHGFSLLRSMLTVPVGSPPFAASLKASAKS